MSAAFPCLVTWRGKTKRHEKRNKRANKACLQYSLHDYKATGVYFTSSHRHCWTAMWWTTSMPLTCHCTLKRESRRYKFSTVERLPWQLVVLISMLQRVRGESLIISAWQRGPTDRAKVKRKSLCSTWEPQLLISSCSAQSCVKLCGGENSGASLCYSLFSFHFFFPLLSFAQTFPPLPIVTPTQRHHT